VGGEHRVGALGGVDGRPGGVQVGGEGGGPVYRLSEPPATFDPPFEAYSVLLVTCKPPKKKLFGIFG